MPTKETIEFYPAPGRHCPYCPCFFMNSHDYRLHQKACQGLDKLGWRKSNYDESEWCSSDKDPQLTKLIETQGKLFLGGYLITLSFNRKWLKRVAQPL